MHYGVLGMKWGKRRNQSMSTVSRKVTKEARKDAKEYARSKMSYGEGAGTRRKLIKNTVDAKTKKDPNYKKEFETQLEKQDMAKHAQKARSERRRKDVVSTTAKTTRGLISAATGNIGRASTTAAGIYTIAHITGVDKYLVRQGQQVVKDLLWKFGGRAV